MTIVLICGSCKKEFRKEAISARGDSFEEPRTSITLNYANYEESQSVETCCDDCKKTLFENFRETLKTLKPRVGKHKS